MEASSRSSEGTFVSKDRSPNMQERAIFYQEVDEPSIYPVDWTWEGDKNTPFIQLTNRNKDVRFHRNFSRGTAVIRSTEPMTDNQHFWEIEMLSPIYGTDVMVGIGTSEADVSQVSDNYISLLGRDEKTWGLSYTGSFHHDGESIDFSPRYGQGSVIGIHLDMWSGKLTFYNNKQYIGVACTGLNGKTLYAMACSTAACSSMRIRRSCSFRSSLEFLCCEKIRELVPPEKSVLEELSLPPGLKAMLGERLDWLLDPLVSDAPPPPKKPGLEDWIRGLSNHQYIEQPRPRSALEELQRRHQAFIVVRRRAALLICNSHWPADPSEPVRIPRGFDIPQYPRAPSPEPEHRHFMPRPGTSLVVGAAAPPLRDNIEFDSSSSDDSSSDDDVVPLVCPTVSQSIIYRRTQWIEFIKTETKRRKEAMGSDHSSDEADERETKRKKEPSSSDDSADEVDETVKNSRVDDSSDEVEWLGSSGSDDSERVATSDEMTDWKTIRRDTDVFKSRYERFDEWKEKKEKRRQFSYNYLYGLSPTKPPDMDSDSSS